MNSSQHNTQQGSDSNPLTNTSGSQASSNYNYPRSSGGGSHGGYNNNYYQNQNYSRSSGYNNYNRSGNYYNNTSHYSQSQTSTNNNTATNSAPQPPPPSPNESSITTNVTTSSSTGGLSMSQDGANTQSPPYHHSSQMTSSSQYGNYRRFGNDQQVYSGRDYGNYYRRDGYHDQYRPDEMSYNRSYYHNYPRKNFTSPNGYNNKYNYYNTASPYTSYHASSNPTAAAALASRQSGEQTPTKSHPNTTSTTNNESTPTKPSSTVATTSDSTNTPQPTSTPSLTNNITSNVTSTPTKSVTTSSTTPDQQLSVTPSEKSYPSTHYHDIPPSYGSHYDPNAVQDDVYKYDEYYSYEKRYNYQMRNRDYYDHRGASYQTDANYRYNSPKDAYAYGSTAYDHRSSTATTGGTSGVSGITGINNSSQVSTSSSGTPTSATSVDKSSYWNTQYRNDGYYKPPYQGGSSNYNTQSTPNSTPFNTPPRQNLQVDTRFNNAGYRTTTTPVSTPSKSSATGAGNMQYPTQPSTPTSALSNRPVTTPTSANAGNTAFPNQSTSFPTTSQPVEQQPQIIWEYNDCMGTFKYYDNQAQKYVIRVSEGDNELDMINESLDRIREEKRQLYEKYLASQKKVLEIDYNLMLAETDVIVSNTIYCMDTSPETKQESTLTANLDITSPIKLETQTEMLDTNAMQISV